MVNEEACSVLLCSCDSNIVRIFKSRLLVEIAVDQSSQCRIQLEAEQLKAVFLSFSCCIPSALAICLVYSLLSSSFRHFTHHLIRPISGSRSLIFGSKVLSELSTVVCRAFQVHRAEFDLSVIR